MFDKDAIKKEIIEGSNIILKRYDENDVVESISVMNTKGHVIFLGSLRVYNEMNVKNIEKEIREIAGAINNGDGAYSLKYNAEIELGGFFGSSKIKK